MGGAGASKGERRGRRPFNRNGRTACRLDPLPRRAETQGPDQLLHQPFSISSLLTIASAE
jgi:hypothetical protein